MTVPVDDLARRLYEAALAHHLIEPLTDDHDVSMELAYDIQEAVIERYLEGGDVVVGAKLGLTSRAKQRDMGVPEPLYGWLTSSMTLDPGERLDLSTVGQARIEPEIAFMLEADLEGPGVGVARVLAATRWVVPALEVLDSRYRDYRFTLADVVADNASSGRYVIGGVPTDPESLDLSVVGCIVQKNGELRDTAAGGASLGHPATAVAWLVRKLALRGQGLQAGQVVLSGGLTSAVPVEPGDVVVAEFDRLGAVEVSCR